MEQKCCHTEHEQNISKPSHGCGCSEGRILHIHYNWPRSCYSWRPAPTSRCCHSDGMLVLGIKQHRLNYHSIITYFTLHYITYNRHVTQKGADCDYNDMQPFHQCILCNHTQAAAKRALSLATAPGRAGAGHRPYLGG